MSGAGSGVPPARTWGDAPRRALVIHGLSSSSEGWWRFGPELAALGFTVVAPDLRGHGDAPHTDAYDLAGYVADLDGLGRGWDLVVGHSLGGAVALGAVTRAADPALGALVLVDPWMRADVDDDVIGWLVAEYDGDRSPATVAAANPRWAQGDVEAKARALAGAGPEVVEQTLRENDAIDLWPTLAGVTVPTLLVGADPALDALVTPADGAAAEAANPLVTYHMIPEASHSPHRTVYEAFWEVVSGFVKAEVLRP